MELAALLISGGSLLAAACCVLICLRSLPAKLQTRIREIDLHLATYEEHFDALAGNWRSHKIEVEHTLEQLEHVAETVERKRKRIAAQEGAANRRDGGTPELNDRDSWMRRARELGVPGL